MTESRGLLFCALCACVLVCLVALSGAAEQPANKNYIGINVSKVDDSGALLPWALLCFSRAILLLFLADPVSVLQMLAALSFFAFSCAALFRRTHFLLFNASVFSFDVFVGLFHDIVQAS